MEEQLAVTKRLVVRERVEIDDGDGGSAATRERRPAPRGRRVGRGQRLEISAALRCRACAARDRLERSRSR